MDMLDTVLLFGTILGVVTIGVLGVYSGAIVLLCLSVLGRVTRWYEGTSREH